MKTGQERPLVGLHSRKRAALIRVLRGFNTVLRLTYFRDQRSIDLVPMRAVKVPEALPHPVPGW